MTWPNAQIEGGEDRASCSPSWNKQKPTAEVDDASGWREGQQQKGCEEGKPSSYVRQNQNKAHPRWGRGHQASKRQTPPGELKTTGVATIVSLDNFELTCYSGPTKPGGGRRCSQQTEDLSEYCGDEARQYLPTTMVSCNTQGGR